MANAATWTVAGSSANILNGTSTWTPSDASNDLTNSSGNYWFLAINKSIAAGSYEFKICKDHGWGTSYPSSNYGLTIPSGGASYLLYTFNSSSNSVNAIYQCVVAGSNAAIFGTTWSGTAAANEMEIQSDGTFKKVYNDVTLGAGSFQYKIVTNGSNWYPSSNVTVNIAESGDYDIEITFNPFTNTTNATATLQQPVVVNPIPVVVGNGAICNGESWNNSSTTNEMTTNDNGTTYTFTVTGCELEVNTNYEFKIVEQGTWDAYYDNNGGNASFTVDATGIYTIVFTLTWSNKSLNITKTKTGDIVVSHIWSVVGDEAILPNNWSTSDTSTEMTETATAGVFSYSRSGINLAAGTYGFKILADHDSNYGIAYPANNYELNIPTTGEYDLTFTFNYNTNEVSATATLVQAAATELFLIGTFNNWTQSDNNYKFSAVSGQNEVYILKNVTLAADAEFKVFDQNHTYWGAEAEGELFWVVNCYDITLTNAKNLYVENGGTYTFIVDYANKKMNVNKQSEPYSLAGSTALFGGNDDYDTSVEMSATATVGVYTYTTGLLNLAAGNYAYKAHGDNGWTDFQLPNNTNQDLTISAAGFYTVTFTLDVANYTLTAVATAQSETVTKNSVGMGTYVLQHPIDVAATLTGNSGLTINKVESFNYTEVIYSAVTTGYLPAGTPLLLEYTGEGSISLTLTTETTSALTGNKLHAGTGVHPSGAGPFYVLQKPTGTTEPKFYRLGDTRAVPATSAYLDAADRTVQQNAPLFAGQKVMGIDGGETTAIDGIESNNDAINTGKWYNLQGIEMQSPSKGVYINNGKKVVVK